MVLMTDYGWYVHKKSWIISPLNHEKIGASPKTGLNRVVILSQSMSPAVMSVNFSTRNVLWYGRYSNIRMMLTSVSIDTALDPCKCMPIRPYSSRMHQKSHESMMSHVG